MSTGAPESAAATVPTPTVESGTIILKSDKDVRVAHFRDKIAITSQPWRGGEELEQRLEEDKLAAMGTTFVRSAIREIQVNGQPFQLVGKEIRGKVSITQKEAIGKAEIRLVDSPEVRERIAQVRGVLSNLGIQIVLQ